MKGLRGATPREEDGMEQRTGSQGPGGRVGTTGRALGRGCLCGLILAGCAEEPASTGQGPRPPEVGEVLLSQVYYSGAVPTAGAERYYADQFVEIVNASSDVLDLSGMMLGDAYGAAGEINPGMRPDSYAQDKPNRVVFSSLWRLPEGVTLAPEARLVVAHDGANHRPFSDMELSGADFEAYVEASGMDVDSPTVSNLEVVMYNGGFDWLVPVFGASLVLVEAGTSVGEEAGPFGPLPRVRSDAVLDGVDALMDADSGGFKRLPPTVDAGFAHVEGTYVGQALHRRQVDGRWQDTDDSAVDFTVGPPRAWRDPEPDGVFGDPVLELGTGLDAWQALEEGDPVELVAGLQGGWHLDAAVRFDGFGPGGVELVYDAVRDDGTPVGLTTVATLGPGRVLEDEQGFLRLGDRVVLDIEGPEDVVGAEVVVRVSAVLGEATWSDERVVVVVDEVP